MLSQVRNALKGVVVWFFIVLLVLAFALWGVPELQNFAQTAPMRVGDVAFSQSTIVDEFNRQVRQRQDQGADYTREEAIAEGLPDAVVNTLATRSVLEQEAAKMGLVMPRKVVAEYLKQDERFQNPATGEFDEFVLRSILQSNGVSVRQFDAIMQQDLLRNQLVESISIGAPPPKAFMEPIILRQSERRRIAYLVVTNELAGVPAEPTPDALKAYYDANPAEFTSPEYRTFTYVILSESEFREGLSVPEEDLRQMYDANKARIYDIPEKRTIYQATFDSETEAQAAVEALRGGAPFESIAAGRGLSLAAMTFTDIQKTDVLDAAVAEKAFAEDIAAGETSDPIKSLFGWTVVQVAGISPPTTTSFEEARADIEKRMLEQDTRRRLLETIDAVEEARDTGASLAAAAEQAGVEAIQIGPVNSSGIERDETRANVHGEIISAAFRLDEGEETEPKEISTGGYFFVHVDEIAPPRVLPYEEVEAAVMAGWRAKEARDRIAATIENIQTEIAGGKTFAEAADAFNRAPILQLVSRTSANEIFSADTLEKIFAADLEGFVTGDVALGEGQVLIEVREVGFSPNQYAPGEVEQLTAALGYQLNQELLEAYLGSLRDDYGVRANPAAIAQLFSAQ